MLYPLPRFSRAVVRFLYNPWGICLVGFLLSGYMFFNSTWSFELYLDQNGKGYLASNYWHLAQSIFSPQKAFYAESILWPLLARLLGASEDFFTFQMLSGFLFLSLLPIIFLTSRIAILSNVGYVIGIFFFVISLNYFYNPVLGAPDPLVIIFILMMCISRSKMIIAYSILGVLAHFHVMALAILALAPMYLLKDSRKKKNIQYLFYMALGLIIAKVIITGWSIIFLYNIFDRADFIIEKGLDFFTGRLLEAPFHFLYSPGPYFLFTSLAILFIVIFKRAYWIFLAYLWALLISYCAHFVTLDGLRVFTSVTIGSFFLAVTYCLNVIFPKNNSN
jgi:hypothetical protein